MWNHDTSVYDVYYNVITCRHNGMPCKASMSCMISCLGRRLFSQVNDSKEALLRDKVVKEKSFSTTAAPWPFLLKKQSEQSEILKHVIHHFIKPSLACH